MTNAQQSARLLLGTLAFLAAAPLPNAAQTRPFTASDMLDIVQISGAVTISPGGDRMAFVLPDLTEDWNVAERLQVGTVHIATMDGSGPGLPTPVGRSTQRSSFPVFSPDGTRLALFLEGPAGGYLAVWDLERGQMRVVGSHFRGKASTAPQWATDERIVYARPAAPEPEPEQPRVRVLGISDPLPGDAYFRRDRRAGLTVVDLEAGDERPLIEDGSRLARFDVSPDGRHVIASVGGGRGTLMWALGTADTPAVIGEAADRPIWMADGRLLLRRGRAVLVLAPDRPREPPTTLIRRVDVATAGLVESPDGAHFATLVTDPSIADPEIEAPQPNMYTIARPFTDLYVVSASSGAATNLTADIDDRIRMPVWAQDGQSLFFVATDNQTYDETLYRYDVRTERLSILGQGRMSFAGLISTPGGALVSIQSATTPSDLWRFDTDSGARTQVTELNPQLADFAFSDPELFHFDNRDGDRLGGLLYRATGPGAGSDEPVITYVYEKLTPGIHRFQPRHQIFTTHGYAVLMPNVKIKVGEPGTSYVKAIVPAVEAVHAMGFTNGRTCMWGGSWGAYATSFVITQTNIFDCAVSRATPPELFRNWASGRDRDSDNIERGQARMGGSPFEVMENYLSQSAFFHLDQVETPVLITHGMKDYTILFEEGAMMFYALRRLGKEATFVAYRDGDHSLYRHSRADALDVHQRMLDWFERYLR